MADESVYPGAFDGDLRAIVPAGTTPAGFEDFLQLVADAAAKLQTTLGVNPQGAYATVAAAIAAALTAAGTTFDPTGLTHVTATDVQGAIEELDAAGGGGGGGTVDVVSNVAENTILGRITAGSGNSEELTPAQVRTLLDVTTSGAWELLDQVSLGASAAQIDFTGIPTTGYDDLRILGRLRSDRAASLGDGLLVRVGNGSLDTGSNYAYGHSQTFGTSVSSTQSDSDTKAELNDFGIPAATADAGIFSMIELHFFDYANTAFNRVFSARAHMISDAGAANGNRMTSGTATWKNTASAIDTIRLYSRNGANWVAGSKVRLYGIRS